MSGTDTTVKFAAPLVPPPGPGLTTFVEIKPGAATKFAGTVTVKEVGLQVVGVSIVRPNWTRDPEGAEAQEKLSPFTVSGKDGLPAETWVGEILLRDGAGPVTLKVMQQVGFCGFAA
jgi:hypothetical protein